jgi:hypothetical protein
MPFHLYFCSCRECWLLFMLSSCTKV